VTQPSSSSVSSAAILASTIPSDFGHSFWGVFVGEVLEAREPS
jgi:hypothetical protein